MNRINLDSELFDKLILYITEKYSNRIFIIESDMEISDPRIADMVLNLPGDIKNVTEPNEWFSIIFGDIIKFEQYYEKYTISIVHTMMQNLLDIHNMNIREVRGYLSKCKKNLSLYNKHNRTSYDIFNLLYLRNYYKFYRGLISMEEHKYHIEEEYVDVKTEKQKNNLLSTNNLVNHNLFLDIKFGSIESIELGEKIDLKLNTKAVLLEKDIIFMNFAIDECFNFKKNIFLDYESVKDENIIKC